MTFIIAYKIKDIRSCCY